MKFSATLVTIISLAALSVQAHDLPSRYSLARRGNQFVTGPCKQDFDCQQGCCAFTTGKCAGPGIAQTRDGGCGFGDANPNCNVATAMGLNTCVAGAVNGDIGDPNVQAAAAFSANLNGLPFKPTAPGSGNKSGSGNNAASGSAAQAAPKNAGSLAASQQSKKTVFVQCASDSECQQGCCGFSSGKCAGPAVAQTNGSGGCGRGDATPNCSVSSALGFQTCVSGGQKNINDPQVQAAAAFTAQLDGLPFTPA